MTRPNIALAIPLIISAVLMTSCVPQGGDGPSEGPPGADAAARDTETPDVGGVDLGLTDTGADAAAPAPDAAPPADVGADARCVPDCAGRACGPDPVCGESCGGCEGTCRADGVCEVDPVNAPPRITSVTSNLGIMRPTETLVLLATVNDPDGDDDIAGGVARTPSTGLSYGDFRRLDPGVYDLSLTWSRLRDVVEIQSGPGGVSRTIEVVFGDTAGLSDTSDVTFTLQCDSPQDSICSGECVDTETDPDHCGACRAAVPPGGFVCANGAPACPQGRDACGGACVDLSSDPDHCGACGRTDPSGQRVCVNGDLVCPAGTAECEGECRDDDWFASNDDHCGSCGNGCDALAQASFGVVDSLCFESQCNFAVETFLFSDSCNDACSIRGFRCDSAILGFTCGGLPGSKGCAIYENASGCLAQESSLFCIDSARPLSTNSVQDSQCGGDVSDFTIDRYVCDCVE